jgi:hypothetical protein
VDQVSLDVWISFLKTGILRNVISLEENMKSLKILVLLLVLIGLVGCATTGGKKEKEAYVPSFDYTPPSSAEPGSANVTFAIVNPDYSEDEAWTRNWPFNTFVKNLNLDFQEVLNARGFNVRGPYGSYDEMTFPDKKGSDLVLQPQLDVRLEILNPRTEKNIKILSNDTYVMKGDVAVSGRVTLSLTESLSNERMWFKSIELPQTVVNWKGEKEYLQPPPGIDLSDQGITNALGKTMEDFYKKVMQTAWDYLHPEEMAIVKKQAEEIKAKKVY